MFTTKKVNETYISKYVSIHKIYKYSIISIIMKTYIQDWKEIINIKIEKILLVHTDNICLNLHINYSKYKFELY